MADKVVHPDTGKPVTEQFARDMGFLDEAEPYDPDQVPDESGGDAVDEITEDMDDFMSGGGFEEELDEVPEGDGIEDTARRLDDIGEPQEESVRDENDFFGENFEQNKPWTDADARPLYTNNTRKSVEEEEDPTPEIDQREQDWEDTGKSYEETDIGGIRVTED